MMKTPLVIVTLYCLVAIYGLTITIHEYKPDPRLVNWPFMDKWGPIFYLTGAYLAGVFLGPRLMKNRRPFGLKRLIQVYNLIQVLMSAYMFKEFVITSYLSGYSLACQTVDYSNRPLPMRMAAVCWWFFFSKIIDVFDTVLIILRKKNQQLSFLHVYHHASMLLNWWLATKFTAGGQVFFQCMMNSFVHMVMYAYYFLSTFGPEMQKYLWWKRYLTQLQLVQFLLIIVHVIRGMTVTCDFPYIFNWYVICYGISLIALFTNFYLETYSMKRRIGAENAIHLISSSDPQLIKKRMGIILRTPLLSSLRI